MKPRDRGGPADRGPAAAIGKAAKIADLDHRAAEVMTLRAMHFSRAETAAALSLSLNEVDESLQHAKSLNVLKVSSSYEARLEAEQFKIDSVEREAWKAWRATAEATGPFMGPKGAGNPKYLQIILDAHAKRARLLGLILPESFEVDFAAIVDRAVDEAQAEIAIRQKARALEAVTVEAVIVTEPGEPEPS